MPIRLKPNTNILVICLNLISLPPRIDLARMRGIDDASRFNHYKIELVAKAVGLAQL